uniref:Ubiquitin-like protease family profile domain-containing protein n=1 Tax=Mycena chlorophos TaxID=658473 RepID=A0ABQ0LEK8_MYCCL|nr:predicted protein [Mycena chlorophos]
MDASETDGYELTNDAPTPDLDAILPHLAVPASAVATKLLAKAEHALLVGKTSIHVQLHSELVFPLWILKFWVEIGEAIKAQAAWTLAERWLDQRGKNSEEDDMERTVRGLWATMHWHGSIPVFGIPILHLTHLFSDTKYLHSGIVDGLIAVLARRLDRSGSSASSNTILVDTHLATIFESFHPIIEGHPAGPYTTSTKGQLWLRQYGEWAQQSGHKHLYCVLHRPPDHWTTCVVDFEAKVVRYGDGLGWSRPKRFFDALDAWLREEGLGPFPVENSLLCAKQTDGNSCGIIAVNCITANVLGDALWTRETAYGLRMKAFCDIIEYSSSEKDTTLEPPLILDIEDPVESAIAWALNFNEAVLPPLVPVATSETEDEDGGATQQDVENSVAAQVDEMDVDTEVAPEALVAGQTSKKRGAEEDDESRKTKATKTRTAGDVTTAVRPVHALFRPPPPKTKATRAINPIPPTKPSNVGISASASKARELRQNVDNGTFTASSKRAANFAVKIWKMDALAKIDDNCLYIQHSVCGQSIKMKEPYNMYRFLVEHKRDCKGPRAEPKHKAMPQAAKLASFFPPGTKNVRPSRDAVFTAPPPPPTVEVPCTGITDAIEPRMAVYSARTRAGGGGAKDITIYAAKHFPGRAFTSLSQAEKELAYADQSFDFQWRNDFLSKIKASFATGTRPCARFVEVPADAMVKRGPCKLCRMMLATPEFQRVLDIPLPSPANRKYVPHRFQDARLGQLYAKFQGLEALLSEDNKDSYEKRFIQRILNGDFKTDNVTRDFAGEGVGEGARGEREEDDEFQAQRGSRYDLRLDLFHQPSMLPRVAQAHSASDHSIYPVSRSPRFPFGITDETYGYAISYCTNYKYPRDAPLSLAVDDTKLHAALRPFHNRGKWFIVGSTGEPMEVANPDHIVSKLKQIEETQELATKIRLWVLQIPLSKIPPLVLALKAIGSKVKGPQLADWHLELMRGLIARGFRIISSASDGASVERECQRLVFAAGTKIEHRIKFPVSDPQYPDIVVPLSSLNGNVFTDNQDQKHGRKTFRGNASSGAKALVLGNHCVYFQQIHDLAGEPDSPLYSRDVKENRDKQDDRAAARLFSSAMLEHASKNPKKNLGLTVYLLVFGDLIDAWQSRTISHIERAKMAIRAHLFLETWKRFLAKAGYPEARHFISKEAEPNEHCFTALRVANPDATYQEALIFAPKMRAYMQSAVRAPIDPSTYRETANGYCLTYFSAEDVDQSFLAQMPLDAAYSAAYQIAAEENDCLWSLLGVHPSVIAAAPNPTVVISPPQPDPAFAHLYMEHAELDVAQDSDMTAAEELQQRINDVKLTTGLSRQEDLALDNMTLASVALAMEELRQIEEMPDSDPSRLAEIQQDVLTALQAHPGALVSLLMLQQHSAGQELPCVEHPPVSKPCIDVTPDDLAPLVQLRAEHETREAKMGTRTYKFKGTYRNAKTGEVKELSAKQRLAQSMNAIIRRESERGASMGLNRSVRWKTDSAAVPVPAKSGNAANAEAAAATRSKQSTKRRTTVFKPLKCFSLVSDAGISASQRLETGSYGFAMFGTEVVLVHVLTMYAKKGGKASAYSFIRETDSIGSVFYLFLQSFQHLRLRDFRKVPQQHAALGSVLRFAHATAHSFLRLLPRKKSGSVEVTQFDGHIWIGLEAYNTFKSLNDEREKLAKAVATLNAVRGKAGTKNIQEIEEEDEEEASAS